MLVKIGAPVSVLPVVFFGLGEIGWMCSASLEIEGGGGGASDEMIDDGREWGRHGRRDGRRDF